MGRIGPFETVRRRKDGRLIDILLTVSPVRDGSGQLIETSGVARDITERKKADANCERLFELSHDLMCVVGTDGFFKRYNPAWTRTLGWGVDELSRTRWVDLVHPDDREQSTRKYNRHLEGEPVIAFKNRYRHADGS